MKNKDSSVLKPNRFLLHKLSLSPMALNLFSLLLIKIKEDYREKFYFNDAIEDKDIDILSMSDEIKSKLKTEYTLFTDEICNITGLTLKQINRKILINERLGTIVSRSKNETSQDKETGNNKLVYDLYLACKELNTTLLTIFKDNGGFDMTTIVTSSSYDGKKLEFSINPNVAFELIEYTRNKGFTKYDAKYYFSLPTIYQKKLFELATKAIKNRNVSVSLFEYLESIGVDPVKNKDTIAKEAIKYLVRPLDSLIKKHDSWSFDSSNPKGFRIINEKGTDGSGTKGKPYNEKTMFVFSFLNDGKMISNGCNNQIGTEQIKSDIFYPDDKIKSAHQAFKLLEVGQDISKENAMNLINSLGELLMSDGFVYNNDVIESAKKILKN